MLQLIRMKFKENMKINFVGLLCVINVILIFQVLIMKMKLNLLIVQFVKKNDMVLCAHRCINILENGERCKISVKGDTLKKYNGKVYNGADYELSRGCIYSCAYCVETIIQKYYGFEEKSNKTGAIKNFKSS